MRNSLDLLSKIGLLPVLKKATAENAPALVRSLRCARLPIVDLPYETPDFSVIAKMISQEPDQVLAVSGVKTPKDCAEAAACGAELLIAYALYPDSARWCAEQGIAYVPACTTSSEIEIALSMGLNTVLFTPCNSPAPCAQLYKLWKDQGLRFLVCGDIDEHNHVVFADKLYITAVRGSFLCPDKLVAADDYPGIESFASRIYHEMLGFELGHIGIGTSGPEEGHCLVDQLGEVFGMPSEHGNTGNWALMRGIEVVNGKTPGLHGHIAVQCNSVVRAIHYMENNGHPIRYSSFRFRYPGRLSFAYLEEEFGGFAIHLMLRWTAP